MTPMLHTMSLDAVLCGDRVCSHIVRAYPWVWNSQDPIETRYGTLYMSYGYLSDGSSSIAFDMVPDAFFAHDRLYQRPIVWKDGKRIRLNRFQCDRVYMDKHFQEAKDETNVVARILRRAIGIRRFIGLAVANSFPNSAWKRYREQEERMGEVYEEYLAEMHRLPDAFAWDLPTMKTRDARHVIKEQA